MILYVIAPESIYIGTDDSDFSRSKIEKQLATLSTKIKNFPTLLVFSDESTAMEYSKHLNTFSGVRGGTIQPAVVTVQVVGDFKIQQLKISESDPLKDILQNPGSDCKFFTDSYLDFCMQNLFWTISGQNIQQVISVKVKDYVFNTASYYSHFAQIPGIPGKFSSYAKGRFGLGLLMDHKAELSCLRNLHETDPSGFFKEIQKLADSKHISCDSGSKFYGMLLAIITFIYKNEFPFVLEILDSISLLPSVLNKIIGSYHAVPSKPDIPQVKFELNGLFRVKFFNPELLDKNRRVEKINTVLSSIFPNILTNMTVEYYEEEDENLQSHVIPR